MRKLHYILISIFLVSMVGCKEEPKTASVNPRSGLEKNTTSSSASTQSSSTQHKDRKETLLTKEFKDYWFSGEAEITSYTLKQSRYGEIREGEAVLIFVTEDFLPQEQVKADQRSNDNIPVLKLNSTKNFVTGIYPYSIMQSTFYPVADNQHALKVTSSVQEWCGQVYAQLNNKDQFNLTTHSYFASEGDQELSLKKAALENELFIQMRVNPFDIKVGNYPMIPSFEYLQLKHKEFKAYDAQVKIETVFGTRLLCEVVYPELNRTLRIIAENDFPYNIISWNETYRDGGKEMTTSATVKKRLKTDYWTKNSNANRSLRDSLDLQ